ncbi:MAG: GNAT family N-acetyltransferase [Sphingobacterium sp.]|jgi:aminoglycoside 6'-N-acetyltransferase I|nr:GNAT family N-acetyltransferase [Sphingobacterium sp.]
MRDSFQIKQITNHKDYPYDLLLLADETIAAIDKYLYDSLVYGVFETANKTAKPIAVFCLYRVDSETLEIKNIAVSPDFQSMGLGSQLLDFIKANYQQYPNLIVGTADCGLAQIRFYERNGFVKYAIRKDFFIENYEQPIYENGTLLKDMIMLRYTLGS